MVSIVNNIFYMKQFRQKKKEFRKGLIWINKIWNYLHFDNNSSGWKGWSKVNGNGRNELLFFGDSWREFFLYTACHKFIKFERNCHSLWWMLAIMMADIQWNYFMKITSIINRMRTENKPNVKNKTKFVIFDFYNFTFALYKERMVSNEIHFYRKWFFDSFFPFNKSLIKSQSNQDFSQFQR